jgi:hypothetical protein
MKVEIEISSESEKEKELPTAEDSTETPMSKEEIMAKLRALFAANGPGSQMSSEALKEEIDSLMEKLTGEDD